MAIASNNKDLVGITNFQELVDRVENPKDKLLAACIATLVSAGNAETFLSYLANLPEPQELKITRTVGHVLGPDHPAAEERLSTIAGMSEVQVQRAFGINAEELGRINDYLGLKKAA